MASTTSISVADEYRANIQPLLTTYCIHCHTGDDANGNADFSAIATSQDVAANFEMFESAIQHLHNGTMPPADEPQPTQAEEKRISQWFETFVDNSEPAPAVFRPRRLSAVEYRNTLHSVFGFSLDVAIIEAEQTLAERSLVIKLLPTDPPGSSGFRNDTHANPISTVAWEQYSILTDAAIEQLFSKPRQAQLEILAGPLTAAQLSHANLTKLFTTFLTRAWRRPATPATVTEYVERLEGRSGPDLTHAVGFELKTILMSPRFLYRGLLAEGQPGERQIVDPFEFAERLSYFLWADGPDQELLAKAADGSITDLVVIARQVDRMLASPKARSLAEDFATEWLTLNEIEHVSDNPPRMLALKSQPLDFMHYLFTENRPLLELIDSDTTFLNPHTAGLYGADARQLTRYIKQTGIEIEAVPNQKITLAATSERGGLLTMPGILAMNRGPIIRGTWMLEKILGEDLPDPPPDVGQVPANQGPQHLSFRQRFELHRSNPTCAVCHDKVDPLGFALEDYGADGRYLRQTNSRRSKKQKPAAATSDEIDTSGKLPSGETFADIRELKHILQTSQRRVVVRNIVQKTMSYALCRKLMLYDRATLETITDRMVESNGTWQDLIVAVAGSIPFRETIMPATAR